MCCDSWGHKELDTTELLNCTEQTLAQLSQSIKLQWPSNCLEGGGTNVHCESEMKTLCFLLWDMKCLLPTQLCRARLMQWPSVIVRGASIPDTPKSKFNILIKSKHSKSQETMNTTLVLQTLWHS